MDKYIIISDISRCPCYSNINARLLYLHIACRIDTGTYDYAQSLRRLALETGLTLDAVRHALKQLVRDGLVTTQVAPHIATQYAPQATPQATTHLHLVTIKDLQPISTTTNSTANTTAYTTANTTECATQLKELNKKPITHTRACELAVTMVGLISREFGIDEEASQHAYKAFLTRQQLKSKTWESDGDLVAHVLSWVEKRVPRRSGRNAIGAAPSEAEKKRAENAAIFAAETEAQQRRIMKNREDPNTGRAGLIAHLEEKAAAGDKKAAEELKKLKA